MAGRNNRRGGRGRIGSFTGLEPLEERKLLAATASFDEALGLLTVMGDDQDNAISISRSVAGVILVNGGSIPVTGGTPTVGSTFLIEVFGLGGNDQIALDEINGALPAAHFEGGAGNDTLTGGSGQDVLIGGEGNDTLFGMGGNDRMVWNPGDDTDFMEGGLGVDTVQVTGGGGTEQFTTTANGTRVRFDRLNPAPFSLDIGTTENLVLNMNGGDDSFSATGNLAALIQLTVDGGLGNDTIFGSNGIDVLIGGDGADFIDGQQGNDVVFLGAGDDVFQWDPGDGSDVVEGQDGADTMRFNGSNGSEILTVSANGTRIRFTRDLGNIVMDVGGVERIDLNAFGSTDTVVVNDVSGTDLTELDIDLATFGGVGDAAIDNVIVNATNIDDVVLVEGDAAGASVLGLAARVTVTGAEVANDRLTVRGLAGDDIIDASGLLAGAIPFTAEGGADNDILIGSAGADTLLGQDGDDVILDGPGLDVNDGGLGSNVVIAGGPSSGAIVTIFGDDSGNIITISRDAGGNILHNGAAIPGATVANTAIIRVVGRAGNDTVTLDESNGALPAAVLYGGAGVDTLTGGSGGDFVFGGAGDDILLGRGGFDLLFGGADDDTLTGGDNDDFHFGEAGNDVMVWNPGDDTDLMEGGLGVDTVQVNGGGGTEQFTTTANGTRVRFDRLDPAPFSLDIGTTENLVLNMNGGDDSFSATGNLAALIQLTVDGGLGNDTIFGSNGIDVLIGGDGADFIDGQQGNDVVFLGAGDDVFQWDPGDGSDVVEGQDGLDTMVFNGSNTGEIFDVSANGQRVRFTRNVGTIVMDLNGVEVIDLRTLGSPDTVIVNDVSGTGLAQMRVDLAGTIGGNAGDTQADTVIVNATSSGDDVEVFGAGTSVTLAGATVPVTIRNSEGANDSLVVNALGGNDTFDASALPAGVIKLTLDGGVGNDTFIGSAGADVFLGGDDADYIEGGAGNDIVFMGAGDDTFVWNPGDGNDIVEGQGGLDTLVFNGSNANENINVFANGGRVLFLRDVANVTIDMDDVEVVEFEAMGGADNIVVGDLSGTDMVQINLDLGIPGEADTVAVTGTNGADVFGAAGSGTQATVFGLQAQVHITGAEAANDRLFLNGLGGDDVVDASALQVGVIGLTINGGLGNDVLIGSQGADLFVGGDGNDLALMGGGDDIFVWNPGDDNDTLEGQGGVDTMLFNGSNVSENINVSANGGRVRFFRDIASVVMDLDGVEAIDFNALGGADIITVNDLSSTDLTTVNLNLAAAGGAGDAQIDSVFVMGTSGDDEILLDSKAGAALVIGPHARVNVTGAEPANDRLTVNALGGNDVVTATIRAGGTVQTIVDGGAGLDTLVYNGSGGRDSILVFATLPGVRVQNNLNGVGVDVVSAEFTDINGLGGNDEILAGLGLSGRTLLDLDGGAGADVLLGGDGPDVLRGGAGNDTVNGGAGDDVIIWNVGDGSDRIDGGAGSDRLEFFGSDARDVVLVRAAGGRSQIVRNDFTADFLNVGGTEALNFHLKAGDDRIIFFDVSADPAVQSAFVDGGAGRDSIMAADVRFDFSASGGDGNDYIVGGWGNDSLDGGSGSDIIVGGAGDDLLQGGEGNDRLHGGAGNDDLRGGAGNDLIFGDAGNDLLDGGDGFDTLDGGEDFDLSLNGELLINFP